MRTEFEMEAALKEKFLEYARNYPSIILKRPQRFIQTMQQNNGMLSTLNLFGSDEKGLERRNPLIAVLGDSVSAGHFEWLVDPVYLFTADRTRSIDNPFFAGPIEITDPREVYHEKFRQMLIDAFEQTSVSVINAGIAGDDIIGMEQRLTRDIIQCQPDLVLINGTLNWPEERGTLSVFEEAMRRVVKRIQAETYADIILMTPNAEGPHPLQLVSTLNERVAIVRTIAKEEGVCLCDTYALWQDFCSLGHDAAKMLSNGVNHPSKAGHEVYAIELMKLVLS